MFKVFKKAQDIQPRVFYANSRESSKRFCDNRIKTSRYNFITFLPLFLIDQFKKAANLYFLFVSLLQQIPGVSPIGRFITLSVLVGILIVLAVKEIIEDIKRHFSDSKVNKLSCNVFRTVWKKETWANIHVGDIIRVESGQIVPADIVIISTSEPNHNCYIQTSSLDGEISYKIKYCHPESASYSKEQHWLNEMASIECDYPNKQLYIFNGVMKISTSKSFPLSNDQVILRGCHVVNTGWVVGVVVYTGHETKLMLNSSKTVIKRSTVDIATNTLSVILFSLIVVLTISSTIVSRVIQENIVKNHWYMKFDTWKPSFIITILTFFILYHNFIPVSLIATVEMVKVIQAYFINRDNSMYTRLPPTHDIVNTCSVIEDLGHVNYIFTDKTGTLTRNEMILKEVSIGTKHYFLDETLQSQVTSQTFEEDEQIKLFFMNLLLCNTVISEESQSNAIQFQSSSPDETAIVTALHRYGFKFLQRLHDTIIIECFGRQELWKILVTIEFSSERQRMSVIAKSPSNRNFIFSKGADNAIIQRLKVIGDEIHETTSFYLDFFAKNGLRTLCVAYKELGEVETELAVSNFKDAFVNLEHRQTLIDQASNEIEKDFTLLGCTGIEDLLQDEVCSTISVLREAQIKIWMLTGDKLETAINVGYSSKLLDEEMKLYVLCSESVVEYSNKLNNIINEHNIKVNIDKKVNNTKIPKNIAIILTGKDLKNILTDEVETKFLNVAINCKTVICCRISPSQKKDVVLLVKKRVNDAVALAIGDGANDCSMIRASHVGVGIVGKEGHHAANTADFAIDEYKLLSRLLFVHGASCYRRICNCVYFVFYKNLVFNLLPFFYNFLTLFSGKSVVLKLHFPFFNGVYTTFQPFCFGLLDMTSSSQASTNVPYLYRSVRKSYHFGIRRFTYWCLNATLHSVLIFILCYLSLSNGTLNIYGAPLSDSLFQTFILTHTLLVITLKSVLEIRNWSWVTQLGIWFGFISYVICLIFLSRLFIKPLYMQPQHLDLDVLLISSPAFYITLFIPCMILLPDFLFHCIRNTWFIPSYLLVNELEMTDPNIWGQSDRILDVQTELHKSVKQKEIRARWFLRFKQYPKEGSFVRKIDSI